jgi:hypothetical protein
MYQRLIQNPCKGSEKSRNMQKNAFFFNFSFVNQKNIVPLQAIFVFARPQDYFLYGKYNL